MGRLYSYCGTTSTSQPFDVGIPVPSVSPPISLHVGGPYGTKIIPSGILPAAHLNSASPNSVRTRAICPSANPISAISSAAIVIVLVRALYSSDSFPTLMSDPCFEVREELRLNRFVLISCDFSCEVRCQHTILLTP